MATQNPNIPVPAGLPDMSKINYADVTPDEAQNIQASTEKYLQDLENRYAQPNWWKVAAGFAKPQLGGFMASLGNATDALGENLEQQRAIAPTISMMRAQLAQQQPGIRQAQSVAQKFAAWKNSGKPMDEATYADLVQTAPNSSQAAAAKAAYEGERTGQTLRTQQNTLLQQQIQTEKGVLDTLRQNGQINEMDYNKRIAALDARLSERPPVVPEGTTGNAQDPRLGSPAMKWTGGKLPPAELKQFEAEAQAGKPEVRAMLDSYYQANPPIVQGMPNGPSPMANTATAPLDTSKFVIKPSFTLPYANPMTAQEKSRQEAVTTQAKAIEDEAANQYLNYKKINDPNVFSNAQQANKFVLAATDADPERADRVTNMLRKAGPVASMLQSGVKVYIGPLGATIHVDADSGLNAGLTQPDQNYRDALLNSVATSAYFNLLSRGITPEKAGADKFNALLLQETGLNQGIHAIVHAVKKNDIQLDYVKDLYGAINKGLPSAQAAGSITPFHDIMEQHPEVKVVNKLYNDLRKDEDKRFLKVVTGGKK